MKPRIVLASASTYRAQQLRQLGLGFDILPSEIDEDNFKRQITNPRVLAETLSRAKAAEVARREQDAIVIGSDQVAVIDGRILSKPLTEQRAVEQLERLRGRTHELITAVSVIYGEERFDHTDVTRLHMRELSGEAIRRYVSAEKPLQCVGAYKIEALGASLFERLESGDPSAIVGLPLFAVVEALNHFGYPIP
ncbi:MAG: Maf family protein [Myxococcota bacterium]